MKRTVLYQTHVDLGAKMVDFAGFEMPVQYEGVNAEHETVRKGVGVFDVSHMGEFFFKGEKVLDLLQLVSSNDASKIEINHAQYTCMPNGKGGIVDDLIIYRMGENEYMLVVNASNIEKDWNWIQSHNTFGVEMHNASDEYSLLAVQGPKTIEAIQSLTSVNLSEIKPFNFVKGTFAGCNDVIISATGYTGSGGFELYCKNDQVKKIWDELFKAGAAQGIKPIGLGARDTLRLEMGFCLYGNDIDDTTSPLEAGLGWVTKFTKDFIDCEFLKKQKETGVTRKLVAFEIIERGIPRHEYSIVDDNDNVIGHVTSGTMSPSMKKGIGLGYVPKELATVGSKINILIRDKKVKAEVVKLPFYKEN